MSMSMKLNSNIDAPSKQGAIANIVAHITEGDAVPMVSGGNGGSGLEFAGMSFSEAQTSELQEELAGMDFEAGCEPASDFEGNVDFDDYTDCVRFVDNGTWYQFLLW